MTEKNARRLRQFGDRAKLLRLLSIPDAALRNARQRDLPPRDLATALAIGILLTLPLRLVNLSSIHLETNLQRLSNGTIHLVFATMKRGRKVTGVPARPSSTRCRASSRASMTRFGDGLRTDGLLGRVRDLEARQAELRDEIETPDQPPVRLHPAPRRSLQGGGG